MFRWLRLVAAAAFVAALCLSLPDPAVAQARNPQPGGRGANAQTGQLLVTVSDTTGAVLPSAIVTVAGIEARTSGPTIAPVMASPQGLATLPNLAPGRYSIRAEFPGFQAGTLADVTVRAGDNRYTVVLSLERQQDSVTVSQDPQAAAAGAKGSSFGADVARAQIDALSDDPTELQQQLADLAGPGAVIRVDSFEGGALPPKSQIRSIHITRDGFAAENHNPNAFFVDIITQPGVGPMRGAFNLRSRPGGLSGHNQLTGTKGPEHTDDIFANLGGALVKEKGSFSLFMSHTNSYETPVINAVLADGTPAKELSVRQPQDRWQVNGLFDYALTRDQTLRVGYFEARFEGQNQGVGGYELTDRAFSTHNWNRNMFVQETGPLGRRTFLNTRVNVNWGAFESNAALEAPTVVVNGAFTSGGAQVTGGRHAASLNFLSDLDYIRGIHSIRTGIQFQWLYYHADSNANYLGTYTFANIDAYQAGTPSNYTRRFGNPFVEYGGPIGGAYIQDDIRVSKALTISPGLRYEDMIHINNPYNFGPRLGVTWAPFKSGRTTLRASSGIFYDYLGADSYEQTIRVNGVNQREVNIVNPTYPDPGPLTLVPGNRYLYADQMAMPRNTRLSTGIDQTFSPKVRLSVSYAYVRGERLFRGLNLNAPVDGVRPDPTFANVVEVAGDASMRQHQLTTNMNLSLSSTPISPIPGALTSGKRFDWHRMVVTTTYTLAQIENNTDGTFAVPPGPLSDEWGPAPNDVRHRLFVSMNNQMVRNFSALVSLTAAGGAPYTIRTGADNNGDGIFNDRPEGIGRNTERAPAQWFVNANLVYTIPLGNRPGVLPPGGIGIVPGAPGAVPTVVNAQQPVARYRLQIGVNAQNITNHPNYAGYSGVMGSRFFQQATTVANPRKVDLTINLSF